MVVNETTPGGFVAAASHGQPGAGPPHVPRVSNGVHKTVPKRNRDAAARYQNVRGDHNNIRDYWENPVAHNQF